MDICRTTLCATMSELWRERNARIFTGSFRDYKQVSLVVINEVKMRFHDMKLRVLDNRINREASSKIQASIVYKEKETRQCKWEPPPLDYIQLCADGSLTDEGGTSAGILRRHDGTVMMAYVRGAKGSTIGNIELEAIFWAKSKSAQIPWRL
ncbi:hypothetical protein FRX31_029379 [Thalictrum thalictroides]|uniref:Uncharacterized protein n=1 Tax=Thalictrum thalictroides TaxID=46969 RepID=A0A7J6V7D5_THATH|nr:hypothetical protein FRX31_029379 [Thalictrum thalictroides]